MHIAIVLEFESRIDNIKFIRKNITRYRYKKNLSFSIRIQIRHHILNIQTQYGRILTPPFGVGVDGLTLGTILEEIVYLFEFQSEPY